MVHTFWFSGIFVESTKIQLNPATAFSFTLWGSCKVMHGRATAERYYDMVHTAASRLGMDKEAAQQRNNTYTSICFQSPFKWHVQSSMSVFEFSEFSLACARPASPSSRHAL
jgi:trimethylamine:corrinoid methyltransferase-like protein